MVKPLNIVMFWFMRDWGQYGRAYEKIAAELAARPEIGRVLCVMPPSVVQPNEYAWPLKLDRSSGKLWALSLSTRVTPTTGAPYRLRKWANARLPSLTFSTLLRMLGFKQSNTLLWLYPPHPYISQIQQQVPHFGQLIQIVDNNMHLGTASEQYRQDARRQYESLVSTADCVIVSSQANNDFFSSMNGKTFVFENAVDEIFLRPSTELPSKSGAKRPRLGYVGWLSDRTDVVLLERLAEERPLYDIILAGPAEGADISRLVELPNVTWLGKVPYEDVPDLLCTFDICLIPHLDTPYSRSMSPLKLFQYLGSGRPIVTTPVAGVDRWQEHIRIANNHETFIRMVDAALVEETPEKSEARIAAAKRETWPIRIDQMLQAVRSAFP